MDKAAILAKCDTLPVSRVEVPEWGDTVHVRTLTARERDAFEASCVKTHKDGSSRPHLDNYRGRLAALVISDDRGRRMFSDDDAGQLGDLPCGPLDRILEAARKLNGMSRDSVEESEGN